MKKLGLVLIFILAAEAGFCLEFSPFMRRLIDASPQQLVDTLETAGTGTFNQELIYLLSSLSYRNPYFYPFEQLDPQTRRQLTDYFAGTGLSTEDMRWIWDKLWNVLMIGAGLVYNQSAVAYEAEIGRFNELANRPVELRKSRYENDIIGFARLIVQPSPGRRAWLPLPASAVQVQPAPPPAQTPSPPAAPAPAIPTASPARIVPKMPDTTTTKVYRIQAGSYLGPDVALEAVTRLRQVGLSPAYEINGEYYRVVIPGIRAADLPITAQLLGSAGVAEAWIREEW